MFFFTPILNVIIIINIRWPPLLLVESASNQLTLPPDAQRTSKSKKTWGFPLACTRLAKGVTGPGGTPLLLEAQIKKIPRWGKKDMGIHCLISSNGLCISPPVGLANAMETWLSIWVCHGGGEKTTPGNKKRQLASSSPMRLVWLQTHNIYIYTGWWYTYPSEKYESQLMSIGMMTFPIYGKS